MACCTNIRLIVVRNTTSEPSLFSLTRKAQRPADLTWAHYLTPTPITTGIQRRRAHTKRHISTTIDTSIADQDTSQHKIASARPLSCLSWPSLVRSYAVTAISSIPILLKPSMVIMTWLAHSKSRVLNPDHNRLLHALLKRTFYMQFCAGESPVEVRDTIGNLKDMGYKGVMLGHAREVVMSKEDEAALDMPDCETQTECNARETREWKESSIETVALAQKDDFVALKFTGAGRQALQHLKKTIPCANELRDAISEVCDAARAKGVRLLFDAEQFAIQEGIENWTLYFMRRYNRQGRAVVYGTYQAYMKRCPGVLAEHLAKARQEDFVLGVKLVRGAYLNSDPRELFWNTIEETHNCYDRLAKCIMQRKYDDMLEPVHGEEGKFPQVDFVLASHNAESVRLARQIRDEQAQRQQPRITMAYGQLMGMADHVSCDLIQPVQKDGIDAKNVDVPQAYKYLVWGTMGECMKYLLRRAHENKDAITRTVDARKALGKEIATRLGLARS